MAIVIMENIDGKSNDENEGIIWIWWKGIDDFYEKKIKYDRQN